MKSFHASQAFLASALLYFPDISRFELILISCKIGKDVKLDYDPCAIQYFDDGKYLVVGGSNGLSTLHSREGAALGVVTNSKAGWVWCIACRPNSQTVVS